MNISRLRALILKEFKQMTRDPSSFLIGIIIPLMLIFLIGHGLSMDVKIFQSPSSWKIRHRQPGTRSVFWTVHLTLFPAMRPPCRTRKN